MAESLGETMGEGTMQAPTVTVERFHALAELYPQGQASDLLDRILEKLLRLLTGEA